MLAFMHTAALSLHLNRSVPCEATQSPHSSTDASTATFFSALVLPCLVLQNYDAIIKNVGDCGIPDGVKQSWYVGRGNVPSA